MIKVRRVKALFIAILIVFSFQKNANANEISHALGAGIQYGGVFGWQGSIVRDKSKFNLGVGVLGLSVGYEYALTNKLSAGIQAAQIFVTAGVGVFLNYHLSNTASVGWVVGIDYTAHQTDFLTPISDRDQDFLISLGYKF